MFAISVSRLGAQTSRIRDIVETEDLLTIAGWQASWMVGVLVDVTLRSVIRVWQHRRFYSIWRQCASTSALWVFTPSPQRLSSY